jgi:formamidopyrimidine-DNA glycosylase
MLRTKNMPELTAVQYMTENLAIWLQNNKILSFSSCIAKYQHVQNFLSQPVDVIDVYRRGKNSVLVTKKGTLILGYNLSGNIFRTKNNEHGKRKFMRGFFSLQRGDFLIFSDKINLAKIDILKGITQRTEIESVMSKKIGPEFWPQLPDGIWWKKTLFGKGRGKQSLYAALKNQKKIAGIGNIIAIETLFRSRISPTVKCMDLVDSEWSTLATQIGFVIDLSMKQHRSLRQQEQSKTKDKYSFSGVLHLVSEGKHRADGYLIYGRVDEPCPQCKKEHIKKTKVGSQPLYWCPHCQKTS